MKVKMNIEVSGVRDGKRWPGVGEAIDLPEDEAKGLVAQGVAVAANAKSDKDDAKVETADAPEAHVEKRTTRRKA